MKRANVLIMFSIVVSVLCIHVSFTHAQGNGLTLEQAKERVIAELYRNDIGKRAIFANSTLKRSGEKIASWQNQNKITVAATSWYFFIDEQPGANWEHQAQYALVDYATGVVQRFPATTPPTEMLELTPLNALAEAEMTILKENLQRNAPAKTSKPEVQFSNAIKSKYAVLLSGGYDEYNNHARYKNDLAFMYKALANKYGYADDEIIVLYANNPYADLDGDGDDDINYAATKTNLSYVMQYVGNNLTADGNFFFFATNHGGDDSGSSNPYDVVLYLWGEWVRDDEFATYASNITTTGNAIYVFEQCHSGGMLDDLINAQPSPCTSPKLCVMSAARHDESSWACDGYPAGEPDGSMYDEYSYYWTAAVYGQYPNGTAVNADTSGDGVVSMAEAHQFAVNHDSRPESPQTASCASSGCSGMSLSPMPAAQYSYLLWTKGGPTDDAYEENDTYTSAYDLSSQEGTWLNTINGYGIQADDDWYKIYVTPNYNRILVDCRFTDAEGDIDIRLYDASGSYYSGCYSASVTDNEYIDCTVLSGGGTYYIRVYYGDAGNQYNLWWDDVTP